VAGHADNAISINAPIDLVWDITNDVESWPRLFIEYAAVEILERNGNTVRFRLTLHPDRQGRTWSWVCERTMFPKTRTVRAHHAPTGVFEYINILWQYEDRSDGVRMRWVQDFRTKPSAAVDDAGMTERINRNTAVQMQRIKDLVEKAAAEQGRMSASSR